MPPLHPPLKNDGPACRVCGCTEHNACLIDDAGCVDLGMTCSWVETRGADSGPLCSACAGTTADLAEVIQRALKTGFAGSKTAVLQAGLRRYEERKK